MTLHYCRSINLHELDLTYEGLKHNAPSNLKGIAVFVKLDLTYEGLKPYHTPIAYPFSRSLDLTYEGLKHLLV